jgi:hypothetical protein
VIQSSLRFVEACRDWPRRATSFSCVDKKRKQKKRPQDTALRVPEKRPRPKGLKSTASLQTIHSGINRNNSAANVGRSVSLLLGLVLLLRFAFAVPLLTLPKERVAKRTKKRNLSEPKASLFRFPLCHPLFWEPRRGSGWRSPSFAYFSWRDKKSKRLPGRPRQPTTKRKPYRITEAQAKQTPATTPPSPQKTNPRPQ